MKIRLSVLFILMFAAAASFGQTAGGISSQPQIVQVPDHPLHAEQHALACERPLVGGLGETYTYARGERPLWEFGPAAPAPTHIPLGDVARALRKEKLAARKAEIVLEKQGS
jgi:hypothetical protein